MKKYLFTAVAAGLTLLAGCTKESYYHSLAVLYPSQGTMALSYADQPTDTLVFVTTDNFSISPDADWLAVPDSMKEGRIENYYRNVWQVTSVVLLTPNTTGKIRTGNLGIHTWGSDDWNQTASATYQQLPWLDVSRPVPAYAYEENRITGVAFVATDSATQVTDTLQFKVYGDWTLTDGKFVHPKVMSGEAGTISVAVDIDPKTDSAERRDSLTLTSCGVTTGIVFKQEKNK
ncbi:MAG: hypothetical protein IJ762_10760 [Bacteroidaceae bacterium]|nr:hypothetical protein [Bacteroidaceae bacterium]